MAQQREKDPNEIGALWLKRGGKGEYMTGTIEGIGPVVCFSVNSKNEKAPTWRVLKSVKQEKDADQRVSHPSEPVNDSDIPF